MRGIQTIFETILIFINFIVSEIENKNVSSSLRTILNNYDIEDLFINEPPIDEIIEKIIVKKKYPF